MNEITTQETNFELAQRTGKMFSVSGLFAEANGMPEGKAIAIMATQILAGQEMGFGPWASVTGVHIIKGKPSLSANLMAAKVRSSERYDYRITEHTEERCTIAFTMDGETVGESTFTIEQAKAAGLLSNQTWKSYPRNMLFARAMSNGVRWFAPDIFSGGVVYTPEEMGAEVDEDGNVIGADYVVIPTEPEPEPEPEPDPDRNPWHDPEVDPVLFDPDIWKEWDTSADAADWALTIGSAQSAHEAQNGVSKQYAAAKDAMEGEPLEMIAAVTMANYHDRQLEKYYQLYG